MPVLSALMTALVSRIMPTGRCGAPSGAGACPIRRRRRIRHRARLLGVAFDRRKDLGQLARLVPACPDESVGFGSATDADLFAGADFGEEAGEVAGGFGFGDVDDGHFAYLAAVYLMGRERPQVSLLATLTRLLGLGCIGGGGVLFCRGFFGGALLRVGGGGRR